MRKSIGDESQEIMYHLKYRESFQPKISTF